MCLCHLECIALQINVILITNKWSYSVARLSPEPESTSSHESISSQPRVKSIFFSFFSIGKKIFGYVLLLKGQ